MKKLIGVFLFALTLCLAAPGYAQTKAKHRVVIQLSNADTASWRMAVKNMKNLKKGWGDDVQIEVVVHGPGISFLLKDKTTVYDYIQALKAQGVVFVACENTIRERNVNKADIVPEAGFVPMGVGEIVMKEEDGWSYLKAGF